MWCGGKHLVVDPSDTGRSDYDDQMENRMSGQRERGDGSSVLGRLRHAVGLQKRGGDELSSVSRGWGPYSVVVEVDGVRLPGIRANKANITSAMLEKLKAIGSLHTLEITNCRLKDLPPVNHIDDLSVLQLSNNNIKVIMYEDSDIAIKASKLEKFICDWNRVETIGTGVFSGIAVSNLTAVNLAHNNLALLPRDFGHGASRLLYLDLSYNQLAVLPEHLTHSCRKLQLLYVQRNALRALPADIGSLKDLRKLFLSHNNIRDVPESIGECLRLEKVRLISNEIRYLPASFVKLWRRKGGSLEELLVEGNPLVQPSITAFEMGGLDRAMKLFCEWLDDRQEAEQQSEDDALMLEAANEGHASIVPASAKGGSMQDERSEGPATGGDSRRLASLEAATFLAERIVGDEDPLLSGIATKDNSYQYYFGHLRAGSSELAEIRNAETKLLLKKKGMYLDKMQRDARDHLKKGNDVQSMPENLRYFLPVTDKNGKEKPLDVERYNEKIPVTDLDLYFNLLVFSTRPMYSSCKTLFERFLSEGNTELALSKQEWHNFCNRGPVKLPQDSKDQIWQLLCSGDSIKYVDFVAGWHIHDIEHQDPFIQRVAKVQGLDFYDMDVEEMQERLKARGAMEATLPLVFEDGSGSSQERLKASSGLDLPALEGERRWLGRRRATNSAEMAKHQKAQAMEQDRRPQISMTTAQYVERDQQQERQGGFRSSEAADVAMDSDALSRDEDSVLSAFDAIEILQEMREAQQQAELTSQRDDDGVRGLAIGDGIDNTPTAAVSTMALHVPRATSPSRAKRPGRRKKKDSGPSGGRTKDSRFRTDVFQVRVALREAFRNMPFEDFKKLVNFLIRGMKRISDFTNQVTYWHVHDPSFRYATGVRSTHSYAQKLLTAMGFVCIADTYWVWPEKHLSGSNDWGYQAVPQECPGLSPYRLDDMVRLLKECQKGLSTEGRSFRGHFL